MPKYLILICLFFACNRSASPDRIIPYEKMKVIIGDMVKADEYVSLYVLLDSSKKHKTETMALYHKIFSIYNTNRKEFLNSFDYYLENPKLARDMFDSLSIQSRKFPSTLKPVLQAQ